MQDQCLILIILSALKGMNNQLLLINNNKKKKTATYSAYSLLDGLIDVGMILCITGLPRKQRQQSPQICVCSREKKGENWAVLII